METKSDFSFCDGVRHSQRTVLKNLREGDGRWKVNNTSMIHYGKFDPSGEPSEYAKRHIDHLRSHTGGVALDVAGGHQGRAVRDLIDLGLVESGLVTNMEDLRERKTKRYTRLGHVAGDIIKAETWELIEGWKGRFAPQGFTSVTYRPYGALEDLPTEFYLGAAHTLLDWMAPKGVALLQIPNFFPDSACEDILKRADVSDFYHDPDHNDTVLLYLAG
jgi:hypothetical protein